MKYRIAPIYVINIFVYFNLSLSLGKIVDSNIYSPILFIIMAKSQFRLSQIPANAKGYRARNGIAGKLYHYMTHSTEFLQSPQAVSVPVPHTTLPEAFRIYLLNYLKKRKLFVKTSLSPSRTEVLVWLREDGYAARQSVPVPFYRLDTARLWPPGKDWEYDEDGDAVDDDGTPIIYV